ncbi:MAG: Kelch repeat-containing protein [Solirubrobacteraceae bacterium]
MIATIAGQVGMASPAIASASPAIAAPAAWSPVSRLHQARSAATVTRLLGGKVLIAAGTGPAGALTSAELFDPASGTTAATGSLGVARSSDTATLITGAPFQCRASCGDVLVTGGSGADGTALASAELFNPASATWTSTGSMGAARSGHTATLLSNGMILVAGGTVADGKPLATAELFNPAKGTWTATGSLADARFSHTATLLANGTVLAAGGVGADGQPLSSAEIYDPVTATWTRTGALADARSSQTASALGDSTDGSSDPRVLVTGGTGAGGKPLASAELYNPSSGSWSRTGSLAVARTAHAATVLPDGEVLVAGGSGSIGQPIGSAELYHPASGRWSRTGSLATARSFVTLTPLLDGRDLAVGGTGAHGKLSSVESYEPTFGQRWASTGALANARSGHTATLLRDGEVLVVGGHTTFDFFAAGCCSLSPLASAEIYDPRTGRWRTTGSLHQARSFHTATLLPSGKVLVTGGFGAVIPAPATGGNAQVLSSAELYDPTTRRWTFTQPMLQARAWHTATLLENGKVLVVGGATRPVAGADTDSAELYDPGTQTWTTTGSLTGAGNAPNTSGPRGAREVHTATLLDHNCGANCGKVLITGGTGGIGSGPAYATAELYDPAAGTFRKTGSMAQVRSVQTATELPDGKVLVAGGFSSPFTSFGPDLYTAELYNPITEQWEPAGPMGNRRFYQTASLLRDGTVLAAGGNPGGNAPGFPNQGGPGLFSSELYNPAGNRWSFTSFLNDGRLLHTATLLPAGPRTLCGDNCGKVLVVGGDREIIGSFTPYSQYLNPLRSAELYTPRGVRPLPRANLRGIRLGGRRIVRGRRTIFIIHGALRLPPAIHGSARSLVCRGLVTVAARRGHRTGASRTVRLRSNCSFSLRIAVSTSRLGRRGRYNLRARFHGNFYINARSRTVNIR